MKIRVKYFEGAEPIRKIDVGDCIDLRANEDVEFEAGEYKLIPLGVAMKLPEGYEAHVYPRSSTFRNKSILMANSVGIIDESYCGNNDQWHFPAYAVCKTKVYRGDRICQFRIVEKMPEVEFESVERLEDEDRGGFGSTGEA